MTTSRPSLPSWNRSPAFWALLLGALLVVAFHQARYVDDAYISFRYALRLAQGAGLSWNLGEPPLEGYSNPLWVLLLTPFATAGLSLETPAFWLGGGSLIATVIAVFLAGRRLLGGEIPALAVSISILLTDSVLESTFIGMETPLYGLLMTLACIGYATPDLPSPPARAARMAALGLLSVTRFEGAAVALAVAATAAWGRRCRSGRWDLLPEAAAVGGGIAATFLARYAIFGEWLPMTVMAKSGGLSLLASGQVASFTRGNLSPGLGYLAGFLQGHLVLLLIPLLLGAPRRPSFGIPSLWVPLAAIGVTVGVCLANGGDWMRGYRLLAPIAGPLALGAAHGIRLLGLPRRWPAAAGAVLLVAIPSWGLNPSRFSRPSLRKPFIHPWLQTGRWLDEILADGDLCLVEQIGMIGYSGRNLRIEDFQGLVNKRVAKHGSQPSMFGKRMDRENLSRNPAVVQTVNPLVARRIAEHYAAQPGRYRMVREPAWGRMFVFLRDDILARPGFRLPSEAAALLTTTEVLAGT